MFDFFLILDLIKAIYFIMRNLLCCPFIFSLSYFSNISRIWWDTITVYLWHECFCLKQVNSNEWHLDTSVAAGGRSKVLQLVVYITLTWTYIYFLFDCHKPEHRICFIHYTVYSLCVKWGENEITSDSFSYWYTYSQVSDSSLFIMLCCKTGLHFKLPLYVRYIPSAKECPLQLELPNGEISKTNGFISPVIHLTSKISLCTFLYYNLIITKSVNIMEHLFWNVADVGRCRCLESPKLYKRFGK